MLFDIIIDCVEALHPIVWKNALTPLFSTVSSLVLQIAFSVAAHAFTLVSFPYSGVPLFPLT